MNANYQFGLYQTLCSKNKKDISPNKKEFIRETLQLISTDSSDTEHFRTLFMHLIFEHRSRDDETYKPSIEHLPYQIQYDHDTGFVSSDLKEFPIPLRWILYNFCVTIRKELS